MKLSLSIIKELEILKKYKNQTTPYYNYSSVVSSVQLKTVSETNRAIVVKVEIPGVHKNAIDLELYDDTLAISVHSYERKFRLPYVFEKNVFHATFEDKTYTITIPKPNIIEKHNSCCC